MKQVHQASVLNRLKTARGHIDAIIRMVENDEYCPDIMKQLSAVQGAVERSNRILLQNHLETCVAAAMAAGRSDEIVAELMDVLKYDRVVTAPVDASADSQQATNERP